ncbi:MAG: tRNA (adenosine(37)-N6)-threonylcarbamoyltransferase complex ATPase subunit type 1 TsaE [Kiritimatiellia bacterium]|nr:tRNA (adenosine(37)-N6)-threonylcarbamoyltransferase complex ATPase subunit type 1 TsaE [Kiritimatiellia bacterium]
MIQEIITQSPEETQKIAAGLADQLRPASVLALHGELGSGKTCFVQGLAKALGVREIVNSPTFAIINEYQGRCPLYHLDLYRVKSAAEAEALGLCDILEVKGISAIEWPEKISSLLPKDALHIYFEFVDANRRRIAIT